MKGKELAALITDGIHPVVTFMKPFDNMEGYLEAGMRGRLAGVGNQHDDMFRLHIDLTEFDDFNKQFESANYFDDHGKPCLTARESGYYKEPKEDFYVGDDQEVDFLVIEDADRLKLYQNFTQDGAGKTYVQWLEDRVIASDARDAQ